MSASQLPFVGNFNFLVEIEGIVRAAFCLQSTPRFSSCRRGARSITSTHLQRVTPRFVPSGTHQGNPDEACDDHERPPASTSLKVQKSAARSLSVR